MRWIDVVGWLGSALLVWSLLQTRILRLRLLNLAGSVVLLVFNAAIGVWPMVGLNTVLTGINLWYLRGLLVTRHDTETYTAVPVHTDDDFLSYTLRRHAGDIARFNPEFHWAPGTPGRLAFLVVRGDETVGVVLARDAGAGVAQLELDYVTRPFRDFTPGEFVFRRSTLFTERGFTTVVSPPRMVGAYYARLGFRPVGDSFALDLTAEARPATG